MKNPGRQFLSSLAAAVLLVAVGRSGAGTTIYTYSSAQPETNAEWSHDFGLPKFDPSLGSLEAVRITAEYDITTSASLYNTSQSAKAFWFEAGSLLTLNLPRCLGTLKVSLFADDIHFSLAGHGSASYGPFSTNGSAEVTLTGSALAPFIGMGTLEFPAQTKTQDTFDGGSGKITASMSTTASAVLTIEYVDTPVPEPSPKVLLFVALGIMPLLLRRRG